MRKAVVKNMWELWQEFCDFVRNIDILIILK